jgi:hypothetical protein
MMRTKTLYEQAIGLVDDEIRTITYHLASNSAKDIEEYRRLCGVVQGLTLATDILKDLQKRQENDADE